MTDGELLVTIVALIAVLSVVAPFLFGALKESGRFRMPRRGKTFRQFPTFEDEED